MSDTAPDGDRAADIDAATIDENDAETTDPSPMEAARYPDGSILYPPHPLGPGGQEAVETVDLSEYTATIITWTTSTATPPGVRQPNHLAIVEFDVDGESVRAVGQLTAGDVEIGHPVEPVYVEELREPGAGIREPESQEWDGYRFRPIE